MPERSDSSEDDLPSDPGFRALLGEVAEAPALPLARRELAPGACFDGLTIARRLGGGGMGVVYLARDGKLEREVAVKVLREDRRSPQARERLLREAQAIAKISHPNVIIIHAVGVVDDEAYLEMEYVEGETLGAYLRAEPRPLRDVLPRFLAAGRGLSAAHDAGLVHRDFKPDNVLCGHDGRVRVTDFGLASTPGRPGVAAGGARVGGAGAGEATPLTATGALIGTPGYMAPEQALGGAVNARADQFSFSVALYEALYGQAPFADEAARDAGRVGLPDGGRPVPARLRALLLRGLAADPARRHPSMAGFLDALGDDPARRWRRRALAAVALAAVALAAWAVARRGAADPCPSAADRLAGVWDRDVAARVDAAFARSGRAHAAATFGRVSALLDGRAAAWLAMHADACGDTRVRGERSAAVLDLRMHCLDRRLSELRASTQVFAEATDPVVVDQALDAVLRLPPIEQCDDLDALARGGVALAPEARARADALTDRVDVAQALQKTGQPAQALAALDGCFADVLAAGDPALVARATLLRGQLQAESGAMKEAEVTLGQAVRAAAEARDDDREAEAWISLVGLATKRRDFAGARALAASADLGVVRAGGGPRLRSRWLATEAGVAFRERNFALAGERYSEALALREREVPRNELDVAALLDNLGVVRDAEGRFDEAERLLLRALVIKEGILGPDHPFLAVNLLNLGMTRRRAGKREAAHRDLARALRLREMLGPDHPDVANVHLAIGQLFADEGRLEEARHHLERAVTVFDQTFGPASPRTLHPKRELAGVLADLGEPAAARRLLEEAIAIGEASGSPILPAAISDLGLLLVDEEPARAEALLGRALALFRARGDSELDAALVEERLGTLYQGRGRCREAAPLLEQARVAFAAATPPHTPAATLLGLGRCHLAAHDVARALPELLAAASSAAADPDERATAAECWYAFAEALWARNLAGDRALAATLAERARATLAADPRPPVRARAAVVSAWLAAHTRARGPR